MRGLLLAGMALMHFALMTALAAKGMELTWGLAPLHSLAAALLICLVPLLGYAAAAYVAVALLEWSPILGFVLFFGPSMVWVLAMWPSSRR